MAIIKQDDFIESVAAALQYISFYHPVDYITNLARAYELEQSHAAKDAMAQILINSRMCAEGHRPICQDTGIVTIFLKVGMDVRWSGPNGGPATLDLQAMCDAGVRKAYLDPDNKLRGSILADPAFSRKNTFDNTPCVVEVSLVQGGDVDVIVAAKGGGSEAKSKFVMLNPSDSIVDWVLKTVPTAPAVEQPGNHLLRRPVNSGNLWLNATFHRVNFNLAGYFTGVRTDSDFDGLGFTRNPGYARFDFATSYNFGSGISFYGRVTNLLDKQYQEAIGFPALGRDFRLGLNYRLSGRN